MNRRSDPRRLTARSYPFWHEIRSQFRDMDALGHINNVVLAAYYEDSRAHFLRTLFGGGRRSAGNRYVIVAGSEIDYLGEALHPRVYQVGVGVLRIGRTSVVVASGLFQDDTCLGLADVTVVNMLDGRPEPLTDEQRMALSGSMAVFAADPASD